ncbi:MAG: YdgA family protein [Betaproteobacteria bacterium]|nr:YdgA family protein [Betaproteobacteria bacterium]
MKKSIFAAVALVLLGAAYAGATWWSGVSYQQAMSEKLQRISERYPFVQVVAHDYQPGFFNSSEEIVLGFGCGGDEHDPISQALLPEKQIKLHSSVRHGPFLGASGFGLASFETAPVFSEEAKTALARIFKGADPLKISGKLSYSGDSTLQILVSGATFPPGNENSPETTSWQPLEIGLRFDEHLKHFDGNLHWPHLTIGLRDGYSIRLDGLSIRANKNEEMEFLFLGEEEYGLDHLDIVFPSLEEEIQKPGELTNILAEKIHFSSRSKLDDGLVSTSSQAQMQNLKNIGGQNFGPGKFTGSARNLDAQALAALNRMYGPGKLLRCEQGSPDIDELDTLLVGLLKRDPAMEANLDLDTSEGKVLSGIRMQSSGMTEENFNFLDALSKIGIAFDLQWPETLPGKIATQGKSPEEAEQIQAGLQKQINEGVVKNFLIREGASIKTRIELKEGRLQINGKPAPLPFLPS